MLIIYPAMIGKAKPLCAIMGNPIFNCLAKITYAIYMLHLVVFYWYMSTTLQGLEYSIILLVARAVDVFAITIAVALIMTLLFESPVINMEKYLFRKRYD